MSDTLVSGRTLEQPSDNGQVERASEGQPQSETGGQTSDNGQAAQENIRKLQSTYDKKVAALSQQVQQSQQYIQQLTQQMREAQRNAAPDDYTKLQIELQWEQQEKAALAQRLAAIEAERQNDQGLHDAAIDIAEDFNLLTTDEVIEAAKKAGAKDYKSAYKAAAKLQREKEQGKQARDDDKRKRNTPDLGGGEPRTAQGQWETDYNDARRRKDSVAMMRLLQQRGKQPQEK